jgi:hypothetical protein
MKKTLLLTIPVLLMASQSDINKKIEQLEHEVQLLKEQTSKNQKHIDDGMDLFEKVETKSILDKINLSPELLLRFDKFNYNNGKIEGENTLIYNPDGTPTTLQRRDEYTKDFDLATSIRFRLNMSADIDGVKFHGRMLYMNSSQSNERICILSRDIKTGTAGSAFDVDRAYVDYTINNTSKNPFTFSFGILPTTAGTPMQYAQNKKRNSMFPSLVFDMNTYGIIGTQKFGDATYARLILAKPYTLKANFYPYQCNRENIDNANIVGLYADTKFDFLGTSLLSFGVNILNNLKAHPYLGPDIDSSDAHDLGTMATFGIGLDIEELANTHATVFLHTALSNPHANGNQDDYKIVNDANGTTANGSVGFTTSDYASGGMLSKNGYSVYLGTKYDFSKTIMLGAEYNYGSKYWFSATQGAEDMFNKLTTRGSCYEVYAIWQFQKYLSAKINYLNIHEDYTGSGWHFGEPVHKDATQSISSFMLEAKF